MMTVPQAAKRVGRDPETVRRWIRSGKLRSTKVGTQHLVDEQDLVAFEDEEVFRLPEQWTRLPSGEPAPNWARIVGRSRNGH